MQEKTMPIEVRERQGQTVLARFPMHQREEAYRFASEMESLDLDIEIVEPSLLDTLSDTLGLTVEDQKRLCTSAQQEIEDHD